MVESLCAMVLLEGCSPRQVFTQFLLARKVGLLQLWQLSSSPPLLIPFVRLPFRPPSIQQASIVV